MSFTLSKFLSLLLYPLSLGLLLMSLVCFALGLAELALQKLLVL